MAKAKDLTVTITANVTCSSFGHRYVKFDATRIFCEKCGTFQTAPATYTYTWPQTQPNWWYTFNTNNTIKSDCTSL